MFCSQCGTSLPQDAAFCRSCGAQVPDVVGHQKGPMATCPFKCRLALPAFLTLLLTGAFAFLVFWLQGTGNQPHVVQDQATQVVDPDEDEGGVGVDFNPVAEVVLAFREADPIPSDPPSVLKQTAEELARAYNVRAALLGGERLLLEVPANRVEEVPFAASQFAGVRLVSVEVLEFELETNLGDWCKDGFRLRVSFGYPVLLNALHAFLTEQGQQGVAIKKVRSVAGYEYVVYLVAQLETRDTPQVGPRPPSWLDDLTDSLIERFGPLLNSAGEEVNRFQSLSSARCLM